MVPVEPTAGAAGWNSGGSEPDSAEFDRHLRQAERLLARVDDAHHRARVWHVASRLLPVGVAAVMVTLVIALPSVNLVLAGIVATALSVVIAITLSRQLEEPNKALAQRDEWALTEIITLLRDLAPVLAEEERWSFVRQQTVQARIARFPIGPR